MKFNLIGDIDEAIYKEFVELLDDDINKDVLIELTSHGGDAMVALAFYDRIKAHKGSVTVLSSGIVASAAVLILAAGDKRAMSKNAWVMLHEDVSLVDKHDRVTQAEARVRISRQLETQWNKLLAKSCAPKSGFVDWAKLHKDEAWLSSEDCLVYGLIDKII